MSTSSVSPASSASSPSSVTAPQSTLTGSTNFSSDIQAAVTRAVAIASLPIQLLQADQTTVQGEASELGTLNNLFGAVQTSLQSVSSGTSNGALAATSSDTSVAQASLSGTASPGTYTVDVLNAGSESSAISSAPTPPITDPTSQSISQASSLTLTVGTQTYTVQPSGTNLNALASAINSSGAPVQALVVNLGSPTAPDYRLVVQSTNLGDNAIQLGDGTNNSLLNVLATGSSASYTVDGQPPGGITTNSSTVTIGSGVTASLEGQTGSTTVTVSASLSSVSSALSNFVTAFNAAVAELANNPGQSGGALTGDSSVLDMGQVLNEIGSYTGTPGISITNLTQLGVEFTDTGTLTFDPTVIAGLSQQQTNDALTFLGSPTTGGFLQYATNALNGITDPTTGVIATEGQALQNESNTDQTQITNDQAQITQLQANLNAQMAASDALIATLQQQNTFLQGLFQYATSNNPDATSAA
jgi:flagellar hook-associated protein 2